MITRRQAVRTLVVAGCGAAALGLYTWRIEPHWLEFSYPILTVRGLPQELQGGTLAQLSDLHIGPRVDDDYIVDTFRRVKELAPDFVAYTGGWITYYAKSELERLRRGVGHLLRVRFNCRPEIPIFQLRRAE